MVKNEHAKIKKKAKKGKKGRGSKVTFLSKNTQNRLIDIIGNQITEVIVEQIKNSIGWSIIVDSTPDVARKEQLSICVRIISPNGLVSEHILSCKEALSVTAMGLFSVIIKVFESKKVTFDKLVAQTYDGASNMSGCYNGLQAIIKEKVGKHILYVHCYAHSLNLVLKDTVSDEGLVHELFEKLESLHNLVNRTTKVHQDFENVQKEMGLDPLSVKRLNTVRWNSRELCLKVFLQRYDPLMRVLQNSDSNNSIDSKKRAISKGLNGAFLRKDIIATAILFKEIFVITGPLNTYLQSIDMDFGQANALVAGALDSIQRLRNDYSRVEEQVKKFKDSKWDREKQRPCRNSNQTEDSPEVIWRREIFYPVLDQIISSIKSRFDQNKEIFDAISLFSPKRFASLLDNYRNCEDLAEGISALCVNYGIDKIECARELMSFAATFPKLKNAISMSKKGGNEHVDLQDSGDEGEYQDGEGAEGDNESEEEEESCKQKASGGIKVNSYHHALQILANPIYHLVDAYPLLYKIYGFILAIPITSCTAERTFSVLKRVKSRLRSTMGQERLEQLLMMAIERNITPLIVMKPLIDLANHLLNFLNY